MPVISRDQIKEGYVNTYGVKHDELSADSNGKVTELFFELVRHYLTGNISVVIEAAFQHKVWEPRMQTICELASPVIVICWVDADVAARRHLQRGLEDPTREYYHGDKRVAHYRQTGEVLPPETYDPPTFDVPTIKVSTDGEYIPPVTEIVKQIKSFSFSQSL